MAQKKIYENLATLLEYPLTEISATVNECVGLVEPVNGDATAYLKAFERYASSVSLDKLREVYTSTFDLNPVCSLNISFHVLGESYKRGAFLVGLRQMLRDYEVDAGTELPDHLSLTLRLLGRMKPGNEQQELLELIVAPGLAAMKKAFQENDNVYGGLIRCADIILRQEHGLPEQEAPVPETCSSFFTGNQRGAGCQANASSGAGGGRLPAGVAGPGGCPLKGRKI